MYCLEVLWLVMVVQRFSVGLVIERSLVRLLAVRYQVNYVNSAFHPSRVGK